MPQISEHHMREYETLYILKPEIEDEVAVTFINKMKTLVETEGGKHLQLTNWGRKKLAWERDRHQKGMFVHHRYLGKSGLVKEYERALGIEENCLLRQTILLKKGVDADSCTPEADVIDPPPTKESRREERDDDRPRRDSRGPRREEFRASGSDYAGDMGDDGPRDRGGRDDDRGGRDDDRGGRGGRDDDD